MVQLAYPDAAIQNACQMLFGPDAAKSSDFLFSLRIKDLKSAFRKKALETHPDRFHHHGSAVMKKQSELFIGVTNAYETIQRFCEQRDLLHRTPRPVRAHRAPPTAASRPVRPAPRAQQRTHVAPFAGTVPRRLLEIGSYLYFRKCIPYSALIRALVWQKGQRPSIGVIAQRWGWLNDELIRSITAHKGYPRLFGERAERLGLLKPVQVRLLLAFQRTQQKKLGQYFVENGYLTAEEMEQMVEELKKHNREILKPRGRAAAK